MRGGDAAYNELVRNVIAAANARKLYVVSVWGLLGVSVKAVVLSCSTQTIIAIVRIELLTSRLKLQSVTM